MDRSYKLRSRGAPTLSLDALDKSHAILALNKVLLLFLLVKIVLLITHELLTIYTR